jgi:hypothetical protein
MRSKKLVLMNRKGNFIVIWHNKKELHLESIYGAISTEQVDEVLSQIYLDLLNGELFFLGEL